MNQLRWDDSIFVRDDPGVKKALIGMGLTINAYDDEENAVKIYIRSNHVEMIIHEAHPRLKPPCFLCSNEFRIIYESIPILIIHIHDWIDHIY